MKSGIYLIENTINKKVYVGSSNDIANRFRCHRFHLKNGTHGNSYLQNSFNKYGEEAFSFTILEYCDVEKLQESEIFWMTEKKSLRSQEGYNLSTEVDAPRRGYKMTEEEKEAIKSNPLLKAHWKSNEKEIFAMPIDDNINPVALYFSSVKEAGAYFRADKPRAGKTRISDVLNGRRPHSWGYQFYYN